MTSWLNQVDKTFLHLINGFIRVRKRVWEVGWGWVRLWCLGGGFIEGITVRLQAL